MLAFCIFVAWMLASLIEVALLLGVTYLGVLIVWMIRSTRSSRI